MSTPENPQEETGGAETSRKKSVTSSVKLAAAISTGKSINSSALMKCSLPDQQQQADDSAGEDLDNSDSELSDADRNFLTKGAFLLTPSNELTLEKAGTICEKMNFRGPFSLTKTATGILFKFAEPDDCTAVYKKGFHKVTGARFYKKIPIPCRPMRTFVVYVLDIPEAIPVEDIRHALYKFQSVVEVSRVVGGNAPPSTTGPGGGGSAGPGQTTPPGDKNSANVTTGAMLQMATAATGTNNAVAGYCPLVRITLGSQEEANTLLQNGLDFYGATYFPTETTAKTSKKSIVGTTVVGSKTTNDGLTSNLLLGARIRELLPVFDATGFNKIPAPAERTIKPR